MATKQILAIVSTMLVMGVLSVHSKATRIMGDTLRNEYIQDLQALLNYEDQELRDSIPYVVNPFFFEQPLLLKLRAPGGVKDMDLLKSIGVTLVDEISGAFVRGSRRSLLMKNGDLIKEGDTITKKIASFGGLEATVTVESIDREKFVLKLNKSVITVDLTGKE